jgi:NADH dehydrogenase, FAD-containing subunit
MERSSSTAATLERPEAEEAVAAAAAAAQAEPVPVRSRRPRPTERPQVVIIGGGFAGLEAAKVFRSKPVDVTVVDRTNHHVFQPLLYQVATAALAPSDISSPIRQVLRNQDNVRVVMAEVGSIDPDHRAVHLTDGAALPYDCLILATGTRHSYFGHDEWEKHAPGLKSLKDALNVRQRFLEAFEEAERIAIEHATDAAPKSPEQEEWERREREAYLTFVIVGGGPTGCELAGVLPEIAKRSLRSDYRYIDAGDIRVILVEAGPRILAGFPEKLSEVAKRDLEKLGARIRTGELVTHVDENGVTLKSGERIESKTVIWAAGNAASPLAKFLGVPLDRAGRVLVNPDLSVPGHPEIFVAGDLAATTYGDGKPVPAVAQGAIQGGRVAAKNILHRLYREETEPFRYFDKGNMAVLGRKKAIADFHVFGLSGFLAWLMWLFIHLMYLVGFRNRLSVLLQWGYAYATWQRGVRIIQPEGEDPPRGG